jgi:capsular polysaccharide biosynthesis protein
VRAHSSRWVLPIGLAVTAGLIVFTLALVITFILPESFCSTARIALRRAQAPVSPPEGQAAPAREALELLPAECEVIRSELILGTVVQDLELNQKWGKRYLEGVPLKTTDTVRILKGRLELQPMVKTGVIEVRVLSEQSQEAADIANDIVKAYKDYALKARADGNAVTVEVLDTAVPAVIPARPNKPLNIALGLLVACFVALGTGVFTFLLQRRFRNRREPGGSDQLPV